MSESEKEVKLKKQHKIIGAILFTLFALSFSCAIYWLNQLTNSQISASLASPPATVSPEPIIIPEECYGFLTEGHDYFESVVESGQTLADLLLPYNVGFDQISQLAALAKEKDVFDVRLMRPGNAYMVLTTDSVATHFVLRPSKEYYCVFELADSLDAYRVELPVITSKRQAAGQISSNLWEAMTSNGMDFSLAATMERVLGSVVSFHHLQKGDAFKLLFDEKTVDGEPIGGDHINAVYFKTGSRETYAYYYEDTTGTYKGYYDHEGRPLKRTFLKAPVLYSRISSRYNLRRFHPVLRRVKAHLGTDFAAPYGTPIMATAAGTITKASYTRGNGRFVKVRHNKTYETQYLHMQKIAKGIRPGVTVAQGQVIGYVGSSGLATGPHVCYRFWKNGKQVDPLRQQMPAPKPMPEEALPAFFKQRDVLRASLDNVAIPPIELSDNS